MHQSGILNTNVQSENQSAIFVEKKDTSREPATTNTENDKKLKKMWNPKKPKKAIPTSR